MSEAVEHRQRIGRFEVVEALGPGRRGLLFRAHDNVAGRDVALELCEEEGPVDPGRRDQRRRALRAAAGASHARAARAYEEGEQDRHAFFVSDWPSGRSLVDVCASGAFLRVAEALRVVADLCLTLQSAHENGVVHGDLYPGNVWLDPDGTVHVGGFGTASFRPPVATLRLGDPSKVSGLAPEQVAGGPVDGRTDVFAAGAILYELLAGRAPFEGDNASEILDRVAATDVRPIEELSGPLPPAVVAAVHRSLARKPADRYSSAFEFAAELQRVRGSLEQPRAPARVRRPATPAPVPPTRAPTPKPLIDTMPAPPAVVPPAAPAGTRRLAVAAIVTLAAAALIVGGVALHRSRALPPADQLVRQAPQAAHVPEQAATETPAASPASPVAPVAPLSLRLTSTPEGAQVVVNDEPTGMLTPATIELPAGEAVGTRIRVTKDGFAAAEVRLDDAMVAAGAITLALVPVPRPVTIRLVGDYPFSVFDGSKRLSAPATSHTLTAMEGATLRAVANEYFLNAQVPVHATDAGSMSYSVPGLGSLSIRAAQRETCSLSLNGKDADTPPFSRRVAAGRYDIRLVCPDGERLADIVVVRAGESQIVTMP